LFTTILFTMMGRVVWTWVLVVTVVVRLAWVVVVLAVVVTILLAVVWLIDVRATCEEAGLVVALALATVRAPVGAVWPTDGRAMFAPPAGACQAPPAGACQAPPPYPPPPW
jgi:hypothetical protein